VSESNSTQAGLKRSASPDQRVHVCATADLQPGDVRIVEVNGKQVGVYNVGDEFTAFLNFCPHEGAPVCAGRITGYAEADKPGELRYSRENELLCCPWHGWEFDLKTGECLVDRCRLARYETQVEDGQLYVLTKGKS